MAKRHKKKGKRYVGKRFVAGWCHGVYVHRVGGKFAHFTKRSVSQAIERAKKARTKGKSGYKYKSD